MAIYNLHMAISVTRFKHSCLEIIRGVEKTRRGVALTRRGRVVARLEPSTAAGDNTNLAPWERLRVLGGRLLDTPGGSVLDDKDFEALG